MRTIIVDLEATCWQEKSAKKQSEIIEIGTVELASPDAIPHREFARFVRPIINPVLSDFCRELTHISQRQVDAAQPFTKVFPDFLEWIGEDEFSLCSWGVYDVKQFALDCQYHDLEFPSSFERHINLKQEFANKRNIKPCGMKAALRLLQIPLEGTHHRGIDDARNIAKIAQHVLPYL